jgi:hypothetical protein
MPSDNFEKKLRARFEGATLDPTPQVWERVQAEIRPGHTRHEAGWWSFTDIFLGILLTALFWLPLTKSQDKTAMPNEEAARIQLPALPDQKGSQLLYDTPSMADPSFSTQQKLLTGDPDITQKRTTIPAKPEPITSQNPPSAKSNKKIDIQPSGIPLGQTDNPVPQSTSQSLSGNPGLSAKGSFPAEKPEQALARELIVKQVATQTPAYGFLEAGKPQAMYVKPVNPGRTAGRWSVGLEYRNASMNYGPVFRLGSHLDYSLSHNNTSAGDTVVTRSPAQSQSVRFRASYSLSSRLQLYTGIGLQKIRDTRFLFPSSSSITTLPPDVIASTASITRNTRYTNLEVPVGLSLSLPFNRFSMRFSGGLTLLQNIRESISLKEEAFAFQGILTSFEAFARPPETALTPANFTVDLGAVLTYRISAGWEVYAGPEFRQHLRPLYRSEGYPVDKPHGGGLILGLQYRFKSR